MANLPPLDDPRLDILVGIYAESASRLQALLGDMLLVEGPQRFLLFQRMLGILEGLKGQTDAWSARFIQEFVREADASVSSTLAAAGVTSAFDPDVPTRAIETLAANLNGTLEKARQSLELQISRIFRNPALEREFPDLALQVQRQIAVGLTVEESLFETRRRVANLLQQRFRDGAVSVIGKGGRRFRFPLDFYAGMVAQNTRAQARSAATLLRAQEAQTDLVQVDAVKSKTGDWCDAYRGRVYSISGGDPNYPPLSALPGGGPPFHPWCRHSVSPFIPEFFTPAQQQEAANTDPRFLMRPGEADENRVVRNWWDAVANDTVPAGPRGL